VPNTTPRCRVDVQCFHSVQCTQKSMLVNTDTRAEHTELCLESLQEARAELVDSLESLSLIETVHATEVIRLTHTSCVDRCTHINRSTHQHRQAATLLIGWAVQEYYYRASTCGYQHIKGRRWGVCLFVFAVSKKGRKPWPLNWTAWADVRTCACAESVTLARSAHFFVRPF
jgi:hypothetical protein